MQTNHLTKTSVATKIVDNGDGDKSVKYHTTEVVRVAADKIILNHGGYVTTTTAARMNQASGTWDLGFRVFRRGGSMFCEYRGDILEFEKQRLELTR